MKGYHRGGGRVYRRGMREGRRGGEGYQRGGDGGGMKEMGLLEEVRVCGRIQVRV